MRKDSPKVSPTKDHGRVPSPSYANPANQHSAGYFLPSRVPEVHPVNPQADPLAQFRAGQNTHATVHSTISAPPGAQFTIPPPHRDTRSPGRDAEADRLRQEQERVRALEKARQVKEAELLQRQLEADRRKADEDRAEQARTAERKRRYEEEQRVAREREKAEKVRLETERLRREQERITAERQERSRLEQIAEEDRYRQREKERSQRSIIEEERLRQAKNNQALTSPRNMPRTSWEVPTSPRQSTMDAHFRKKLNKSPPEELKVGQEKLKNYYEFKNQQEQNPSYRRSRVAEEFRRRNKEGIDEEIKRYKTQRRNSLYLFMGAAALITLLFIVFISSINSRLPFCDTGVWPDRNDPECTQCPMHGQCAEGKLVSCNTGFKIIHSQCVLQSEDTELINDMYEEGMKLLERTRGDAVCHNRDPEFGLDESTVKNHLLSVFKKSADKDAASYVAMKRLSASDNSAIIRKGGRLAAVSPSFSFGCLIIVFASRYKWLLILCGLVLGLAAYFVLALGRELNRRNVAKRIYLAAETALLEASNHSLVEEQLKKNISKREGLSLPEVYSLWGYVIREAEQRRVVDFVEKVEGGIVQRAWWIEA